MARLVALQCAVFTAAGWVLSAVLDLTGVSSLTNALFFVGLGLAVLAGFVILESSNVPVASSLRASTALTLAGVPDRL
ncbi:MAG TPA: hypothetical protein VGI77_07065, partial [Gaiellaceae bacterium]